MLSAGIEGLGRGVWRASLRSTHVSLVGSRVSGRAVGPTGASRVRRVASDKFSFLRSRLYGFTVISTRSLSIVLTF